MKRDPTHAAAARAERQPAFERPGGVSPELKLVAMREHSLLSLFELSHELTVALDEGGIAELALFNLMGHLGTAQALLILQSETRPATLELVRSYGVRDEVARAMAAALESALQAYPGRVSAPMRLEDAKAILEPAAVELA